MCQILVNTAFQDRTVGTASCEPPCVAVPSRAVLQSPKFARFTPFAALREDTSSLLDAMLLLGQHGLHRIPVLNGPDGVPPNRNRVLTV